MDMLFVISRWQFPIFLYLIYFSCADSSLQHTGFSSCDVQALQHMGSVGAEHMLSCGMWDLSSPTRHWTRAPCFGSAVLTTEPPGKSQEFISISFWGWRQSVLTEETAKTGNTWVPGKGRTSGPEGCSTKTMGISPSKSTGELHTLDPSVPKC